MTTVHVLDLSGVSANTTVHVLNVSGAGAEGSTRTVHVLDITGLGVGQPSLSTSQSVYEPGQLVTVAAINRGSSDSFTVTGGFPADGSVDAGVLTFRAPATAEQQTYTIGYNGLVYVTITVRQAFGLTRTGVPVLVMANLP